MSAQVIVKCPVCGTEAPRTRTGGECSGECFAVSFWQEKVRMCEVGDMSGSYPVARIGGRHHVVHPHRATRDTSDLGCAGREFTIRWTAGPHAGKVMRTNNLMVQGNIPEEFRERLPDNAEFVREAAAK